MDQNKEKWVEAVLGSTQGMQRAQAPNSLKQKIDAKINEAPQAKIITLKSAEFKWLAAAVILLVGLNIAFLSKQHQKNIGFKKGGLNQEYSFGTTDLIKL